MTQPCAGKPEEAPLGRAVEEHLSDGEREDLRISDARLTARAGTLGQEIICEHIKCDEQGVEVGRHEASLVVVALATPDFDAQPEDHSSAAINSESII
jgi:hypothetical protein